MRIALIGNGKTGSHVQKIIPEKDLIGPFNSAYKIEDHLDEVKKADAIIVFTSGEVFLKLIDILIETKKPVICGSTGHIWPEELNSRLRNKKLKWVYASNFSIGMSVVQELLKIIGNSKNLFKNCSFNIEEIHHIHKKDAPSGTALSWKEWLNIPEIEITSKREGDVVGIHKLTIETKTESISINHTSKDRSLFAEGAIFAAEQLINNSSLEYGLHQFSSMTSKLLNK